MATLTLNTIRTFVLVFFDVASHAIATRVPEPRSIVALLADYQSMATGQGKPCTIVVEAIHLPVLLGMAGLALAANLTLMLVVLLMAADAKHRRVAKTLHVFVTGFALNGLHRMRTFQPEPRLVMLKQCGLPVIGRVAIGALLPECCDVLVVFLVAGKTVFAGLLVHESFMARLAFGLHMFPQQRKI